MGRRRDPDQAAKGFPARRRTKAEIADARAQETATLLASAPIESGDGLAPPNLLHVPGTAGALAVWREYAPRLRPLNLLAEHDRHTFALFCVYTAEFYECAAIVADPAKKFREVKTVSGDKMIREHPAVGRMDVASSKMLELSKRFGLTPLDRYDLLGKQSAALGSGGGLFAPGQPPAKADKPAIDAAPATPLIGGLDGLDSAPPGRPN